MAILRDPSGKATIEDIASGRSGARFEPMPSMLTEGYRKGAVWVRFSLSAAQAPHDWLLQIERPLIEQVALYGQDRAGHFEPIAPGYRVPGDGAGAYPALFPISVPSAETKYYVRFQSRTSITTALNVWQKDGYEDYRSVDDIIIGIVIGAIGAMALANLLYALWLRDSLYVLYVALLVASGTTTIFHLGYASAIFGFLAPESVHRLWGAVVCGYDLLLILFLARIFEFHRHGIWAWRLFQGFALLMGVAGIFAIAGRYGDVALLVSRLMQISFISVTLFVSYLLIIRRHYHYVLPALSFAGVIGINLVMQIQYTGANPFGVTTSLSRELAIGALIHLVLLNAAVAKRTRVAERDLDREKDRVIAVSRLAEQQLSRKVEERTAELARKNLSLKAEVDRRHLLEMKLRQSLDSVNDALAQQRNFVAVVSHEFRGPLGVISAAAENLSYSIGEGADDTQFLAAKIRQTVRRMTMLIENVLADDRLGTGGASPARSAVLDLNAILRSVEAGLDDEGGRRVRFAHGAGAMVKGDRTLLEIVVQNLVQNALKYSPESKPVHVRLSTGRGAACIEVDDQGGGVSAGDRDFIFMKYYRASGQQATGSGLGLYIAREIARQHQGELALVASGAGGSTFRLSLPSVDRAVFDGPSSSHGAPRDDAAGGSPLPD